MAARSLFFWAFLAAFWGMFPAGTQAQQTVLPQPTAFEILFSISPRGISTVWPPFWGGDVASDRGYVVARNGELLRNFSPPETFAPVDYGLDALQELNWGPVAIAVRPRTLFSLNQGFSDQKLGWISDGDLLSDTGQIVARNRDLMANFHPMPPLKDMGLDAVFIPYYLPLASSALPPEIWFSVAAPNSWFDEKLGRTIGHGDLLSSRGYVVATNAQLLRNFQPVPDTDSSASTGGVLPVPANYGLDAVYVPCYRPWYATAACNAAATSTAATISPLPLEIWFSVSKGFVDKRGFTVSDGDLLSTTGRVVRTNSQLLSEFHNPTMGPVLLNYGLDAVYVRGRNLLATSPSMDATVGKVGGNQVRLVFDGQVDLPAGAAVSVTSLPDGQDVTNSFDISLATADTLVIQERGSTMVNTGRYRIQPTDAFAVEPFQLDVGKLVGDVNGDGAVDVRDLLRLADSWGSSQQSATYAPGCDFNSDGQVNVADLLIFADGWAK